jgi:hypothetical protein
MKGWFLSSEDGCVVEDESKVGWECEVCMHYLYSYATTCSYAVHLRTTALRKVLPSLPMPCSFLPCHAMKHMLAIS